MHLPTHTPFFRTMMCKTKRALHLFLKIIFFCSLLLLLTPETLPYHLFRKTKRPKIVKKLPKAEKFFFFFCIIYFTFSLSPYRKKQSHLLFSPFLSSEIEKPQGKKSHKKIFFFFFYYFFASYRSRNRENYHLPFFRNSDLKCPKMPISALKFHFVQITFFPP